MEARASALRHDPAVTTDPIREERPVGCAVCATIECPRCAWSSHRFNLNCGYATGDPEDAPPCPFHCDTGIRVRVASFSDQMIEDYEQVDARYAGRPEHDEEVMHLDAVYHRTPAERAARAAALSEKER